MNFFLYFCSLNDKMGDCVVKKRRNPEYYEARLYKSL